MTQKLCDSDIFEHLTQTIESRKSADIGTSYVAKLIHGGHDRMLRKISEETTELILAAKDAQQSAKTDHLLNESADLLFHLMVFLASQDLSLKDVSQVLANREGVSGLVEKAARTNS